MPFWLQQQGLRALHLQKNIISPGLCCVTFHDHQEIVSPKWLNRNDSELLLLGVFNWNYNGSEHLGLISFYALNRKLLSCLKALKSLWSPRSVENDTVLQREPNNQGRRPDLVPKNRRHLTWPACPSTYDEWKPACRNQQLLRKAAGTVPATYQHSIVCWENDQY